MNLAVDRTESFEEKMARITEKTAKSALLFSSFCELEKKHLTHSQNEIRPHFVRWIKHQQVKYYNEFIVGFSRDMKWDSKKLVKTQYPTKMFVRMRHGVREGR
ncbi:hypothetical protein NIE88_22170 [Sporolactobacillus shoreicorticis]|uniref:Transposase n=1 Tax=Sporolactobacillus shoreicorticis TaxID=1923877 RepID=A0ABW5SAE4_9BACL|nr:hypothetical protein [Sporolactobacillus shoreicorticis]MCO7128432.1 hypothetical protein [Sporolactobacillus shoreicorticis]